MNCPYGKFIHYFGTDLISAVSLTTLLPIMRISGYSGWDVFIFTLHPKYPFFSGLTLATISYSSLGFNTSSFERLTFKISGVILKSVKVTLLVELFISF